MLYPLRLDNDEQETWEVLSQEVSNSSRSNNARRICDTDMDNNNSSTACCIPSRDKDDIEAFRVEHNSRSEVSKKRLTIRKVDLQQLQQIAWVNTACHE